MSREETVTALAALMPSHVDDACQLCDDVTLAKLELVAREVERCNGLAIKVTDGVEATAAVDVLASATAAMKEAEAMQAAYCDPIYRQWKDARAIFSGPIESLKAFTDRMRKAIGAYTAAEQARQDAERRRLQREADEAAQAEARARMALEEAATSEERKAASDAAAAAIEAQRKLSLEVPRETKGVKTDAGTYSVRRVWVVAGIHDLSKVPEKYLRSTRVLTALTAELSEAVRHGERDIPGVSLEEREDGTFRGRR
jgi:hypothetical protein